MPRIGSIAGRSLANTATRRTFASYPFSGPNISASATALQLGGGSRVANISTWIFSSGKVSLNATGLPYHSFGNEISVNTPAPQNYIKSWTYRGGTTVEGNNIATSGGPIGFWLDRKSVV